MRFYKTFAGLAFIIITMPVQSSASSLNCPALPNAVSDPVGDAQTFQVSTPDIVCAAVYTAGKDLQLAVTFNPATFDQATASVAFELDTDRNPATGVPPTNPPGPYLGVIGVDFSVLFRARNFGGNWVVDAWDAPHTPVVGPIQYFDNGMLASIPVSALDGTDGILNYVVESQTQLSETTWTFIGDYTPGFGQIATTASAPEPSSLALLLGAFFGLLAASRFGHKRKWPN